MKKKEFTNLIRYYTEFNTIEWDKINEEFACPAFGLRLFKNSNNDQYTLRVTADGGLVDITDDDTNGEVNQLVLSVKAEFDTQDILQSVICSIIASTRNDEIKLKEEHGR